MKRPVLVASGVAAVVLAVIAAALRAAGGQGLFGVAEQLPGLGFVAVGLLLAGRLRDRNDPQLLVAAGLTWLVGNLALQDELPTVAGVTTLTLDIPRVFLVWVVLGLPGGRLRQVGDRALVVATAVLTGVLTPLWLALSAPAGDPVRLNAPSLENLLGGVTVVAGIVLVLLVGARVVHRYRAESPAGRRILGPVLIAGVAAAIADGASIIPTAQSDVDFTKFGSGDLAVDVASAGIVVTWTVLALAFFVAISRSRLSAGAVGRLLPDLSRVDSTDQIRAMLAGAVGDPTLTLEIDPGPVAAARAGLGRATTEVTFGEHTLARLHHDAALLEHPAALEAATAALGLLLGRRRLARALDDAARQSGADRLRLEADLARVRDAFGAFVDPAVADSAIEAGWDVGGHEVEVTVMFLDVRDFTPWAERSSPSEVVSRLNALWELVVPLVLGHGGHANKFIGDGLLAVFGAPRPFTDHADRALAAAEEIVAAIARRFGDDLKIGLGLHSGPVMAGTIGGGGRVEFTVIGDVVNTAARIEAATRGTADVILVSDATRDLVASGLRERLVSRPAVVLKGKSASLHAHAMAPGADEAPVGGSPQGPPALPAMPVGDPAEGRVLPRPSSL